MPTLSKTQILIFIIVILLLVNIAMIVSFGMKHPEKSRDDDRHKRPNPIAFTLKEKVGFSDAQMKEMDRLKKEHREKMHRLFEEIRSAKISFYQNVNKPDIADSTIERLSYNIGKKQQEIDLQAFRNFREIRSLCTPEQLTRYDSLMPKVIQNMWFPDRRRDMGKHKDSSKDARP